MKFTVQRKLASDVLGCSPKKVWFDPSSLEKIKETITKADMRSLVIKGLVQQKLDKPASRGRAREKKIQKQKGRRKGPGKRKGRKTARISKKELWINRIRLQRQFLKTLKNKESLGIKPYRDLYQKAKGGFFRSRRHLKMYIDEHNLFLAKKYKNQKEKDKKIKKR